MKKLLFILSTIATCLALQAMETITPVLSKEEADMPVSIPEEYLRKEGIPGEENIFNETISATIPLETNSSPIAAAPPVEFQEKIKEELITKPQVETQEKLNTVEEKTPIQVSCPVKKSKCGGCFDNTEKQKNSCPAQDCQSVTLEKNRIEPEVKSSPTIKRRADSVSNNFKPELNQSDDEILPIQPLVEGRME